MSGMPAHITQQGGRASEASSRVAEVRAAIAGVRDPEIDETIEALHFIVDIEVAHDLVAVSLRLPTFWCPANFVYLMAGEIRRAVLALPWARRFELRLVDHFAADEINRAISEGLSFTDAFPMHAVDNLDELRRTFDRKAFLMRQGALVSLLRRRGSTDEEIARLSADELAHKATLDEELATARSAYLQKWEALHLQLDPKGRIIVDLDGAPIAADKLPDHLRRTRGLTTSASANGEMCRILMAARRCG
jgi:metal-sulfur cluster biosynthetic enzyme